MRTIGRSMAPVSTLLLELLRRQVAEVGGTYPVQGDDGDPVALAVKEGVLFVLGVRLGVWWKYRNDKVLLSRDLEWLCSIPAGTPSSVSLLRFQRTLASTILLPIPAASP